MATEPGNLSLKFINQTKTHHHYYLISFWLISSMFRLRQKLDTTLISSVQSYNSVENLIKMKSSVFKIAFLNCPTHRTIAIYMILFTPRY